MENPLADERFLPTKEQRKELLFAFDVAKFDFRSLLLEMFRLPEARLAEDALDIFDDGGHGESDTGNGSNVVVCGGNDYACDASLLLANLHRTNAACAKSAEEWRGNKTPFHAAYARVMRSCTAKDVRAHALKQRFDACLRSFVREVVAPLIGCAADEVAYQRSPTLRVSLPCSVPLGHAHIDYEYHHPPSEVNFWIPLTRVFGSNSLFAETEPGAGDFHPFEGSWGQCFRFWGNQVRHYCVANDSGATRVSLDFRAIALPRFDPDFRDSRGRHPDFRLGQYYALSSEGGVHDTCAEVPIPCPYDMKSSVIKENTLYGQARDTYNPDGGNEDDSALLAVASMWGAEDEDE